MEQASEKLKSEVEAVIECGERRKHAFPILKRIEGRIDTFINEEREDGNTHTAFGLYLAISEVKKEIEALEG